ncbi:MAG: 50S ribosomal protein L28 [Chloroflexota bacterium]
MARRCELCGKGPQSGCRVSHSKRHTKRLWMVNLHPATLIIDDRPQRLKVCTRCLRSYHKVAKQPAAAASPAPAAAKS